MRRFITIISLVAATTLVAGCFNRVQSTRPAVNQGVTVNQPVLDEPSGNDAPVQDPTPVAETWLSFSAKQCQQNPWEQWDAKSGWSSNKRFASFEAQERAVIGAWLDAEYKITLVDYQKRITSEIVCQSCDCPRGDEVAVNVSGGDIARLVEIGWTDMGLIGCTMDARVCPNGGASGRVAPWCEFEPCPSDIQPL